MLSRLEIVASTLSISKEEALREAIESYIEEVAFRTDVTAGREDVQRGVFYLSEEPEENYKAMAAVEAMKRMSRDAERLGIADMTLEEINAEIAAVRNEK
ncbi:MAG: hypothetical protein IJU76_11515 [Desulfovibrionaceae bacterium]|nr:hypothetical protein [Desulfovibrionaceae bacterium]